MQAATNARFLLRHEVDASREIGRSVDSVVAEVTRAGGYDHVSVTTAEELLDALERMPVDPRWPYDEPEDVDQIRAASSWPASSVPPPSLDEAYEAAVHRAWQGRIVGNMLGKPVEYGVEWTPQAIRTFLEEHDAWPLSDYFPAVQDTGPAHPDYIDTWAWTTRGNVNGSCRDDDVDYTILNLHLLRKHGSGFTTEDVGATWLGMLPFLQTFTAERVALRNLVSGVPVDEAGRRRNPYREYIGAAIRADVFGYVLPGDPAGAAMLAHRDAVLSHVGNGVYSAMWCAALISAAFTSSSAAEAIDVAAGVVPARSRLRQALDDVRRWHADGLTWSETVANIYQTYGHYFWVHAVNNAAVLTAGLLYGDGDFDASIALTVCGGLDTDSNGATSGSVAGILAERIDARWTDPLQDRVRSAVFGYDGTSIMALASSTTEVAAQLRRGPDALEPVERITHEWW